MGEPVVGTGDGLVTGNDFGKRRYGELFHRIDTLLPGAMYQHQMGGLGSSHNAQPR